MHIQGYEDYVCCEFTIVGDSENLLKMNNDLHFFVWTCDPIQRTIKVPQNIRYAESEMHSWDYHKEDHIGEKNPFTEEVHKWYMNNRGYLRTGNVGSHPDVKLTNKGNISKVIYSYNIVGGDGLEGRVYIAKTYGVFVDAKCQPIGSTIEISYSIAPSGDVLFRTVREDEQLTRDGDEPFAGTFRFTTMTQEEYDRHSPGNTEITFVTDN